MLKIGKTDDFEVTTGYVEQSLTGARGEANMDDILATLEAIADRLSYHGTAQRLDLEPGDILHVKVGLENVDGAPWIPSYEELEHIGDDWQMAVPEMVKVVVTPIGQELTVVRPTELLGDKKLFYDSLEWQDEFIQHHFLSSLRQAGVPISSGMKMTSQLDDQS